MTEVPTTSPDGRPRRSFLAALGAVAVGGLAAFAPVAAAVVSVFDPLRKRSADRDFVRVTRLSVLPADGRPRKFTITDDLVDGWTTYQDSPIGAVYLRREGDSVQALNVVCPHAGCFVNIAPSGEGFACPCHKSQFALDGSVSDPSSPAPRGLDSLNVEVRDDGGVYVRFQNFRTGQKDKTPLV